VIWDLRAALRRKLPGNDVYGPTFSPSGRILATGFGNDVQLWSVPDFKPLDSLKAHQWDIRSLAFLRDDDSLLASSGRDNKICLWDVPTGRLQATLTGHQSGSSLEAAAFSLDGKTLVSGERPVVKLWNVATGKLLFTMKDGAFSGSALFSPDGNTLATGGSGFARMPASVQLLRAPSMAEIEAVEHAKAQSP